MATKIELQEQAKKLGLELTGKETPAELKKLIKDKLAEDRQAGSQTGSGENKSSVFFIWLKSRAYINDRHQRIDAGLFQVESLDEYPRLKNMGSVAVEIFEGKIPSMKLAQIAKWSGVNPDKYENNEDLLNVLLTEPSLVK